MGNKKHGFIFYVFWMTLLLLGSVILIFFLYMVVPQSLLDSLKGDKIVLSDSQREDFDYSDMNRFDHGSGTVMRPSDNSDNTDIPMPKENSSMVSSSVEMENMYDTPPPATIFGRLEIQQKGTFTDNTGSTYLVGMFALSGVYPNDFNVSIGKSIQIPVTMIVTIGWKRLPSFREIESMHSSEQEYRVLVPPLEILSIQIPRIPSLSNTTNRLVVKNIKQNLHTIFEREHIPERIILHAQQQLASDYVLKGYDNITLIPLQ